MELPRQLTCDRLLLLAAHIVARLGFRTTGRARLHDILCSYVACGLLAFLQELAFDVAALIRPVA